MLQRRFRPNCSLRFSELPPSEKAISVACPGNAFTGIGSSTFSCRQRAARDCSSATTVFPVCEIFSPRRFGNVTVMPFSSAMRDKCGQAVLRTFIPRAIPAVHDGSPEIAFAVVSRAVVIDGLFLRRPSAKPILRVRLSRRLTTQQKPVVREISLKAASVFRFFRMLRLAIQKHRFVHISRRNHPLSYKNRILRVAGIA